MILEMTIMKRLILTGVLFVSMVLVIGCGGDSSVQSAPDPSASSKTSSGATDTRPNPTSTMAITANNQITSDSLGNLSVSSIGDTLKFNSDKVALPANTDINVIFKNESTALEHNWVIVSPDDQDAVLADAIAAGPDSEWIKPADSRIIAHTRLVEPGGTDTLSLQTSDPGTFVAICTFPGHAAGGMVSEIVIE